MKEKLEKKNKFMHFIEKWLVIGIILFVIIQLTAISIVNFIVPKDQRIDEKEYKEYNKDYLGHWYDGTFFIDMRVEENFESMDKYKLMDQEISNNKVSKVCQIVGKVSSIGFLVFILIAAYKDYKKKLLEVNTPNYIILSGIFALIYKIFEEIDLFIDASHWQKYCKGFLSTASYYPQMYLFLLPVLLILLGLVLRQKQRKDLKKPVDNNDKIIKIIAIIILVIGLSFTLYRFGVRIYELININSNSNIRLPFYFYIFDLPRSYASSPSSYTKIILLRFIKDLPVFISASISLIMFYKIIVSSIKGKIISKENNKRYKIIFISLAIASIIFNLLGLYEVNIYNNEFLYQYKEATYTIAIRSLTEPLLYGFYIYLFKHYVEIGYTLNKAK